MSQLTIYLPEILSTQLKKLVKKKRVSVSAYIADIIQKHFAEKNSGWPVGYFESTFGALRDVDIERPAQDSNLQDIPREQI